MVKRISVAFMVVFTTAILFFAGDAFAQDPIADAGIQAAEELRDMPVSSTVRLLVILTALTFLPAMMLAMTPFTRFVIVLSMIRQAVGLQQSPPNQVIIGLSLFLSLMIMQPTLTQIYDTALFPFMNGEIDTIQAYEIAIEPLRMFMLSNTRREDLNTMMDIGRITPPESLEGIPTTVVVSSFMLSELKTAFIIGVKIYLPFLVLDVVVANILLGMGMMVLPPVILSLPFKILLFVLMDGWSLLIQLMAAGFYGV